MNRRGFSIVELVVVITIIGILLTLAAVSFRGYQANARDEQRRDRAENIARYIEGIYKTGSTDPLVEKGTYPFGETMGDSFATIEPNEAKLEKLFSKNGFDLSNIESVGNDGYGLKIHNQNYFGSTSYEPTPATMSPDTFRYQPIRYDNVGQMVRCYDRDPSRECQSFALYYMTESDGAVHKIRSIH